MSRTSYPHYFKPSPYTHIDVYRILQLYEITDNAIGHAIKKLLVAGGRGAKNAEQDVAEAIVSLQRWQEMRAEDAAAGIKNEPGTESTSQADMPYGFYPWACSTEESPVSARGFDTVKVRLRNGTILTRPPGELAWKTCNVAEDIVAWKPCF